MILVSVSMSIDVKKVNAEILITAHKWRSLIKTIKLTYSLAFDYKGEPQEFTLILPVPVF